MKPFNDVFNKGAENRKRKEEYNNRLLENNIVPPQYFSLDKDKTLSEALKATDNETKNKYISWYAILYNYKNCTKLAKLDNDMVTYIIYMSIINENSWMIKNLVNNNLESKETILKKIVNLTIAENKYFGKPVNFFKCYPGEFMDSNSFDLLRLNELKLTDEGYFTIACKLSRILLTLDKENRINVLKNIFGRADGVTINKIFKANLYSYVHADLLVNLDIDMYQIRTALLDDDIYNAVEKYLADEFKRK